MNTKAIMVASSLLLALGGLAALFMPQEILAHLGVDPITALPFFVQIGGALYLGAAAMNWTAKGSLIGGIYNRPVGIANLVHWFVGALTLVKAVLQGWRSTEIVLLAVVYTVFAICFGLIAFRSPVKASGSGA